jgi:hypothetical protein
MSSVRSRKFRFKLVLAAMMAVGALGFSSTEESHAANCRSLGVYTDYGKDGKPSIFIWNGTARPDYTKLTIKYRVLLVWTTVPSPSDWGIRTNAPWQDGVNANGWTGYFIATRWYSFNNGWNDDSRWQVTYCG